MEITQTASMKQLIYHAHHCVTVNIYITNGLATSNALINKHMQCKKYTIKGVYALK